MRYGMPLNEADIQSTINDWEVNKKPPDGTELVIRQGYLKGMTAPILIDRSNVTDSVVENCLKELRSNINDAFRLGN